MGEDPTGYAFQRALLDGAADLLTAALGREPTLYEVLRELALEEQQFSHRTHAALFEAVEAGESFPCVMVVQTPEQTVIIPAMPLTKTNAQELEQAVHRERALAQEYLRLAPVNQFNGLRLEVLSRNPFEL